MKTKEEVDGQSTIAFDGGSNNLIPAALEFNSLNIPNSSSAIESKIFLITWQGNPVSTNFVCNDEDVNALLASWCNTRNLSLVAVNTIDWNTRSIIFLAGQEGYPDCVFEFRFAELKRYGKD